MISYNKPKGCKKVNVDNSKRKSFNPMAEGQTHIVLINDESLESKSRRRLIMPKLNKEECKKQESLLSSMVENSKKDDHNV